MKQIIWITLALFALATTAQAASFDCAKASTNIEKMICGDSELSGLDGDLAEVYRQVQQQNEDKSKEIAEQRQWLKKVRNICQDTDCLKTAYQSRFEELTNRDLLIGTSQSESAQYFVRCDKRAQSLTVSDSRVMPVTEDSGQHRDVSEYVIDPNSLTKIGGTDMQPSRLPSGRKLYRCQLGKVLYKVRIEPNIQNARIQGECGASEPDISLSVYRNNVPIISDLNFQTCRGSSSINSVQFSEAANSIKVLSIPDGILLPIKIERIFSLLSPPSDWQKAIFKDYPTGDVNADLFIAVYKRDIAAIKQALQNGANPNTKNLNGFPPLALLGTGRETAYRNNKLEEFNHQSEDMAKVLFAAGASGSAKNNNKVTLLDYLLLTDVPVSVIDMLMAHGASVQDGTPLAMAAFRADESLIRKFIDNGADPNKKARDGSTALWTAATTGFYSYSPWVTPPITEYAKCIRLLLQHGAKVRGAVADSMEMPWMLVRSFGKDERLRIILAEIIPYTQQDDLASAIKLAEKSSYPISPWLKDQLH